MLFYLRVDGEIVGKQAPKVGRGITYLPQKTRDFQNKVASYARQFIKIWELEEDDLANYTGGIHVVQHNLYFKRPKHIKKHTEFKTTKPDFDNVAKATFDALQGILYKNDSQICKGGVWGKYYTEGESYFDLILRYMEEVQRKDGRNAATGTTEDTKTT